MLLMIINISDVCLTFIVVYHGSTSYQLILFSICSAEMSRDLAGEIEKLLKSGNAHIKKKVSHYYLKLCFYVLN